MKRKFRSLGRLGIALVMVLSLSLVMAAPVSAQGALTTVSATPGNTMAGVTTTYTIAFTTATQALVGSVDMAFASGFDVSGATYSSESGISTVTISASGQVVTATVTSPATVNAGEAVTIVFSGIVNPAAAAYSPAVTITTKYTNGNAIDTGTADVTITPLPASFAVVVPTAGGDVTAGTVFAVKITALKADGATTETNYTGNHLISFTSTASDPKTIVTFELIDFSSGVQDSSTSFVLNVVETGKTITATDSALSITGTSDAITFDTASLDRLTITGAPTAVVAGVPFSADITVTAEDTHGNVVTGDTRTITWSSSDNSAVLPAAHALVEGTWTWTGSGFTLKTAGAKTLTATQSGTSDTRVASITVSAAAASKLLAADSPGSIEANGYATSTITATVQDEFANTATTSTATITFETSVGEFANGTSTYSVAATSGTATAVLSSTDVGVTTVKVTSGSLTYDTEAVTLSTPSEPTVVWVDAAYDSQDTDGGHIFEDDAWDTIQEGIDNVAVGGTVNVAPGTYAETLTISTAGLTLQSSGTTAATILTAPVSPAFSITINAVDDVTIDGFKIVDSTGVQTAGGILCVSADDVTIKNNVINFTTSTKGGIDTGVGTGFTITGNTLNAFAAIVVHGDDAMISNNTSSNCLNLWAVSSGTLSGATITDNTFLANALKNFAILIRGEAQDEILDDTLISGNTMTDRANGGILIGADKYLVIKNLTITGNTITDMDNVGIRIYAGTTWGTGNTISNNNIYGNNDFGIENSINTAIIDAENNWWGDSTGPYVVGTNAAATGDAATQTYVDYRPWLSAAYSAPVGAITSISLVAGWNFISVPRAMAAATDTFGELLTGIDVEVAYSYDPVSGWSAAKVDADPVEVLEGYWVDVNTAGTITLSYKEGAQEVPASKSLKGDAWNAIGFSRTTALDADTALMSIQGSWSTLIAWDAEGEAYEDSIIATGAGDMSPGKGYWIWMTEDDVLSAISK